MKKTKRILAILLAAAMLVPMTVGCSNSGEAEGGTSGGGTTDGGSGAKPVVRMVVPGISEQSTTDPISGLTSLGLGDFEKFLEEKIPDVDINLISIPWDGWIQKIEAMSTANEMDVAFFTNQVAVPDWYMDLTPYLEKDPDVNFDNLSEWFLEPAVHYTTYKSFNYPEATGKVYGLPLTMACNSIVYDKQLFEDWGVEEPQPDDTMDDLIAKAAQMTGTNPKTGKTNYGAYATSMWMEWYAISYDAVKPYSSDTMMLNELDMDEYVNYIKDSDEVLNYFKGMETIVANSPEGIATSTGAEKFYTEDNDIAINFDTNTVSSSVMKYIYAEKTDVTERFIPITIPTGENGQQGFPEFFRLAINKGANDPDTAWKVVKSVVTNKEIVDFYLTNYASDKISALRDTEGMSMYDYEYNKVRHEKQMSSVFITDDYWTWRTPLQEVNNLVVSKEITPEEARTKFYEGVETWVNNTKAQLGQ